MITCRRAARASTLLAAALAAVVMPASANASSHLSLQTDWAKYSFHGTHGIGVVQGSAKLLPGAYLAIADVYAPDSSRPTVEFAAVFDIGSLQATGTYGALGNRNLCGGPVSCYMANGTFRFGSEFSMQGNTPTAMAQYLVIRAADVKIHDRVLRGWTAQHRSGGALRLTQDQAEGGGISTQGYDAGINSGSTAPGPAAGSVAVAVPACDTAGGGLLTLSGGWQPQHAICPSGAIGAVAFHRTTWRVSGTVAGVTQNTTRLLVIDR
jgi:hypothetical protein